MQRHMRRNHCHQALFKDKGMSPTFRLHLTYIVILLRIDSDTTLGICVRDSTDGVLECYFTSCSFTNTSLDRVQEHIQRKHNSNKKLSVHITFFSELASTPFPTVQESLSSEKDEPDKSVQSALATSSLDTSYDDASSPGVGPSRKSRSRLQVRPTPYKRSGDESSRSSSPGRRASLEILTPLQIPSPHSYLSGLPIVPSPLNQVAYSRPNSPPQSSLDDPMNVDEDNPLPDDNEILAKGSFTIISLPHLQSLFPPIRLIGCTKCHQGVLASSLLTHAKGHNITLLRDEKLNLQSIIESKMYVDDAKHVPSPLPPCPPIEGIKIQEGFSCDLCSYCCVSKKTIMYHFSTLHKGVLGYSKANSKSAQVQAFFVFQPKYFAVAPILRGLDENDPFTAYMQQCVPEIEALKILNPPLRFRV